VYVSVIHGHDQGSLISRTMDRAMPPSVRGLYAEFPTNRFSMGALEAVLDLWSNKTIVACLLMIPEPVGLLPALAATHYRVPVLWLPSVQRVESVSLNHSTLKFYDRVCYVRNGLGHRLVRHGTRGRYTADYKSHSPQTFTLLRTIHPMTLRLSIR